MSNVSPMKMANGIGPKMRAVHARKNLVIHDPAKGHDFQFRFSKDDVFSSVNSNVIAITSQYGWHTADFDAMENLFKLIFEYHSIKYAEIHVRGTVSALDKIDSIPTGITCTRAEDFVHCYYSTEEGLTQLIDVFKSMKARARWLICFFRKAVGERPITECPNDLLAEFFRRSLDSSDAAMLIDSDDDCVFALFPVSDDSRSLLERLRAMGCSG